MAKVCEVRGKKPMVGNRISHAHNVNKRRFSPNLQKFKALKDGGVRRMMVCTACIRSGSLVKAP